MRAPDLFTVTATYNERRLHALAVTVAADPGRVYLLEPDGEGAALVERAVPSFDALRRLAGLHCDRRVRNFAMSPDGHRAALLSETPAGLVLEVLDLRGPPGWSALLDDWGLEGLRWSADGARLFARDSDGIVRVFDDARRARVDGLAIPGVEALSADGARYAQRVRKGGRQWLVLVDAASRREVGRWVCGVTPAQGERVVVSPTGDAVWRVSVARRQTWLHRHKADARVELARFDGEVALFVALADGAALMTREGRFARVRCDDVSGLAVAWQDATHHHDGPCPFDTGYVPHNARYVAARRGDFASLIALDDGREIHPPDGHFGSVRFLTPSPDGARLVAVWASGEVALLDAATLAPEITFELGAGPVACAVAPDGREIHALMVESISSLSVQDGSSRVAALPSLRPAEWGSRGFAVSPDGATAVMVTSIWDASASVTEFHLVRFDLATGRESSVPVDPSRALLTPCFTRDGRYLRALVIRGDRSLVTLDPVTGRTVAARSLEAHLSAVPHDAAEVNDLSFSLSPAGSVVVVALPYGPGTTLLAIADDGSASPPVTVASGRVLALDDHRLAWLAERDTSEEVRVYELATLRCVARLPLSLEHRVETACFVADGALILGLADGRVVRGAARTNVAAP